MKRYIVIIVVLLSLAGIAVAESNALLSYIYDYIVEDWFANDSAKIAILPDGLTDQEKDIYRSAYANGFYDALHPAYIEGVYMLNTKTKKYHLTNCPTTLLIDSNNRAYSTLSPDELNAQKYKPCGQCHPESKSTDNTDTTK